MFYLEIIIGILFCSFWLSQLIFVRHHLNWSNKIEESDERDEKIPVSIIHPIKDVDFELEKNLESVFLQNYKGKVQHIFSFQDPSDPAIPIVQDFIKKFDYIDSIITINPLIAGLNGKSSNMVHGLKLAKYNTVLFIDSDLRVNKDFILKMVRPLSNKKVGLTTCGQMNIGGKDFWTRFFTFLQNSETDFMWAFFTKLNLNVGATGAAFAINKNLLENIGGLERFGGSLLEDLHLGETLYKKGYKLILGPFLMSYVDKLPKEKSFNYAKRLGVGIKSHIATDLPIFILMLSWYWIFLFIAIILHRSDLLYLSFSFIGIRILHTLAMRKISLNKILPIDFIMGLFFDLFGTFYLIYSFGNPYVVWRGIKYKVKDDGYIDEIDYNAEK